MIYKTHVQDDLDVNEIYLVTKFSKAVNDKLDWLSRHELSIMVIEFMMSKLKHETK